MSDKRIPSLGLESIDYSMTSDAVTVNVQGTLRFVNQRFADMIGYEISELIGMSILDLHAPEYRHLIHDITDRRQRHQKVPTRYVTYLIKKNDERIQVEYDVYLIQYEGKPASFTIIKEVSEKP
ncbi:MAG: PAS domain S-box protein [Candidatus Bathyarchaeota archaeon]|nr:PAS domain S-box protein [Candidatus Bathyarchaeota archaeon]